MTYPGGVEDGKSSLASQILRIIESKTSASAQERLEQIQNLCLFLQRVTTRESNGQEGRTVSKDTTSADSAKEEYPTSSTTT